MKKMFVSVIVGALMVSMVTPMNSKASNKHEVVYSDTNVLIKQSDDNSFTFLDKETKIESNVEIDTQDKKAEIMEENGQITEVEYNQKQAGNTIKSNIVAGGENVGTITVTEEKETQPKLLRASSSGAMKYVTTRHVTATMIKVNRLSAQMVVIGLSFLKIKGIAGYMGGISAYGAVHDFLNKTAYLTIKQYANKWQYRNDAYVYKDKKRTKLLKKQTGIPQRHFS